MHNPLHHQHQQQEQLRSQHVQQQQVVLRTGYSASNMLSHQCKHIGYRISNRHSGTYTFTQTNAAGCTSPASSSIVVNAQPLHQQLQQQEQLRSQHVQQQQVVSRSQVIAHPIPMPSVSNIGYRLVTANSGTHTFTRNQCRVVLGSHQYCC
jgi:hypothetical protein